MDALIQGIHTNFEINGQGIPILLLHGWKADSAIFQPLVDILSTQFRCITVDLPGFGKTDNPPTAWNLENYANFVENFTIYLGISKINLIGHSFGGKTAIKLASIHPDRVGKLILVDSSGIKPAFSVKHTFLFLAAKIGKAVFSLPLLNSYKNSARNSLYRKVGETDYITAGPLEKIFLNIISEDITGQLSKITAPTLIIWGKNDTETPLSDAQVMKKHIPDSYLEILENSGHFPFLEQPLEFVQKVTEFLNR